MNREAYRKAFDAIPFSPDFQDRTTELLRDRLREQEKENGNMRQLRFYRCPTCGGILTSTGKAAHSIPMAEITGSATVCEQRPKHDTS